MDSILKGFGKLSLTLISDSGRDGGDAVVCFAQQPHGLMHPVFLHIRSDGESIHALKDLLEGRSIDQIASGKLFDGVSAVQMFCQERVNLLNPMDLFRRRRGQTLTVRDFLRTQQEQKLLYF